MSPHGSTFTELLLGDIFLNKSLLKYVNLPQGLKMYILQRNNGLCMHRLKLCHQTAWRLFPQFGDSVSPPPRQHICMIRSIYYLNKSPHGMGALADQLIMITHTYCRIHSDNLLWKLLVVDYVPVHCIFNFQTNVMFVVEISFPVTYRSEGKQN